MYPVRVTADPLQTQAVILADGSRVSFTLQFVPQQYGWFLTSLTYGGFTLQGRRLVNSPNMLHQFCNQIPFGLACFSDGSREPSLQQDFSSGTFSLYVLTADEVQAFKTYLTGGGLPA